jgi:four helix bundle protein
MATAYLHFTELEVYKECRQLSKSISTFVKLFPIVEKYRLIGQIIRSSRGITACIAEGYGRYYYKENIQYCRIERGSLFETYDHLLTALDVNYIDSKIFEEYKIKIDTCGRLLNGYINYLKKTRNPKEED